MLCKNLYSFPFHLDAIFVVIFYLMDHHLMKLYSVSSYRMLFIFFLVEKKQELVESIYFNFMHLHKQLKKEGRRNEYERHKLQALNQRQKLVSVTLPYEEIITVIVSFISCSCDITGLLICKIQLILTVVVILHNLYQLFGLVRS